MTSSVDTTERVRLLREAFTAIADPARAIEMRAYQRDQFPFFGIPAPARRAAARPVLDLGRRPDPDAVVALADALWREPERECAYAGTDLLVRQQRHLRPEHLSAVERLIVTSSWWDTVDALAANVAGPLVLRSPDLHDAPDRWIADDDLWLRRTALLHQLRSGPATDADRLFAYCERCAPEREFFIRKAIGWALRQHARTDAAAVEAFVARMGDRLSPLSRREALRGTPAGRR